MTNEQQLDSRWLSNTYRAPKGPKKVLDPVEKAAAKERDKKAAAKRACPKGIGARNCR
jgi:hypothetical protein